MDPERVSRGRDVTPEQRGPARACFLWGAARSGTNVITTNLARSRGIECLNEDDPRAFDNYFLFDEAILEALLARSEAKAVFFKAFNDTPRAPQIMARFPSARAIYAIRRPEDTIESFAAAWGERGRVLWTNRLTEAALGRPGMLTRLGAADAAIALAIREAATEAVGLLESAERTDANVAAIYYLWQHSFYRRYRMAESGRVLLVVYERLTADPVEQMARIAGWFGVESAVRSPEGWHTGRGGRSRGGPASELLDRCRALYDSIANGTPGPAAAARVPRPAC